MRRARGRPPRGSCAAHTPGPRGPSAPAAAGRGAGKWRAISSGTAQTSTPGGSTAASLTWPVVALTPSSDLVRAAAAAQPQVAAIDLDERMARCAAMRSALERVAGRGGQRGGRRGRSAASLRPARDAFGPRPARRPARSRRGDPARGGAGDLGVNAPRMGALRGGARLARGQLPGVGADPRRRLGPGRRQRRRLPAVLARAPHDRAACSTPCAAPGPPTRWWWPT